MLALEGPYCPWIHCCGASPRPEPWAKPQRRLAHYLLVTAMDGDEDIVVDGVEYRIPEGTTYLIQPDVLLDLKSDGNRPVWIHFDVVYNPIRLHHPHVLADAPELGERSIFLQPKAKAVWGVDLPVIVPEPLQDFCRTRLSDIVQLWHQGQSTSELRATHMLSELLLRMVEHVSLASEPSTATLESRIVRAESVAKESLGAAFGVEHFAQAAGMSRSRFSTVYKQIRGVSPGMFLRTERMLRAVELLSRSRRSAAEVGAMVGYPDPTAFGRVFRAYSGKTPGQFRRALEFEAQEDAA